MAYKNKLDQAMASKRHYECNKETIINRSKIFNQNVRVRNKKYIKDYLLTHPCVDCGNNNPIVLEFDHVRDIKKYNVSTMLTTSIKTLQMEIDKCEIRCANCHRIVTHNRRKRNTSLQKT